MQASLGRSLLLVIDIMFVVHETKIRHGTRFSFKYLEWLVMMRFNCCIFGHFLGSGGDKTLRFLFIYSGYDLFNTWDSVLGYPSIVSLLSSSILGL